MKKYFILIDNLQKGPYSIEELSDKKITIETLVWSEGMENWEKLKNIPEIVNQIKSVPPPPPKITKNSFIKKNKAITVYLLAWLAFHSFAIIMSYTQIDVFNYQGNYRSDEFWPFVNFEYCYTNEKLIKKQFLIEGAPEQTFDICNGKKFTIPARKPELREREYYVSDGQICNFSGLFNNYDWTEFLFYILTSIFIYLLIVLIRK